MQVLPESSMKLYQAMVDNPPKYILAPPKQRRNSFYSKNDRNRLVLISSKEREKGIAKAIQVIGGLEPLIRDVTGEIVIKPNCNTDDIYPRDTHPDTVRIIASLLIQNGVNPTKIVVGDMSGRARGLPTRATINNLGISKVAEELGLQLAYFDEEPWVKVKPVDSLHWPNGIAIPKRIYDAERVILTPILRSHTTATFTCAMKLGVGIIDAASREWLHDGQDHYGKLIDINTTFSADLVVSDAIKMNTGFGTDVKDEVQPRIIIVSDNMVTNDAAAVAIMRYYKTVRLIDLPTKLHDQFKYAEKLKLGASHLNKIDLETVDMDGNSEFSEIVEFVKSELGD